MAAIQEEARGRVPVPPQVAKIRAAAAEILNSTELDALDAHGSEIRALTSALATQASTEHWKDAADTVRSIADATERAWRSSVADEARDKLLPFITDNSSGRSGMNKYDITAQIMAVISGQPNQQRDMDFGPLYEQRATWTTSGGSAIATDFGTFYVDYLRNLSPMLDPNVVRVVHTQSGAPLIIPTLTADSGGGTAIPEGSSIGTANPTFAGHTFYGFSYKHLQDFTAELDQDSAIAIQPLLAQSAARGIGISVGSAFTSGTGTVEPTGFLVTASAGATATLAGSTATSGFFSWADLVALYTSVPTTAQLNGTWMVSTDAYTRILSLHDDNNRPVVLPGDIAAGAAPTLLGRPLKVNPAMVACGSAVGSAIAFGDFSTYIVREAGTMRVEVSKDWQFGSDVITLRTAVRYDGFLADSGAIKRLKLANA